MTLDRNRLYCVLFAACLAGYIWLYYSMSNNGVNVHSFEACLIKHATDIPCPSCGTTRSVMFLAHGNVLAALGINPIGLIVAAVLLLAPLWIMVDLILKTATLFNFYKKTESYLQRPLLAVPLVLLLVVNWIWNITKGL